MGRKNHKSNFTFFLRPSLFQRGMTLSEIIVVVAILGILILLASLSLRPRFQLAKARDAKRKADLKTIAVALEDYLNDNPCYPEEALMNICEPGDNFRPYLAKIPCDPLTDQPYIYTRPDDCKQYVIYATLELETEQSYGSGNYAVASSNLRTIPTIIITPTPTGAAAPTEEPTPTATSAPAEPSPTPDQSGTFFGCISGVCVPLSGPDCNPNYIGQANCFGLCGTPENPLNECD